MQSRIARMVGLVLGTAGMLGVTAGQVHAVSMTFNVTNSLGDSQLVQVELQQTGLDAYGLPLYGGTGTGTLASGAQITFSNIVVGDPVLSFSTAVNFGSATPAGPVGWAVATFAPPPPIFGLPIAAGTTVNWLSSVNGTYADGDPVNGGNLDPCAANPVYCGGLGSPTIAQFDINGILLVPASVGAAQAFPAGPLGTQPYPIQTLTGTTVCPAGGCVTMSSAIAFIMGGAGNAPGLGNALGDNATINTVFRLDAVPEPGTLVLLASGLTGLVVLRLRRRA